MSIKSLNKRWLDANFYNGGGTGSDGHYWFRDHLLFYSTVPYKRLVLRGSKPAAILTLDRDGFGFKPGNAGLQVTLSVPDIGVFSTFGGDYLDDKPMHERMKMIMTAQIRDYVNEDVNAVSASIGVGRIKSVLDKLRSFYRRWGAYSQMFDLNWKPVDALYLRSAEALVETKLREWNDPINIERRTREKSRRLLKNALDL